MTTASNPQGERVETVRLARDRLATLARLGTQGLWEFRDVSLKQDRETFESANVVVDLWDVATCSGGEPHPGAPIEQRGIADAALIASLRSTVEPQLRILDAALNPPHGEAPAVSAAFLLCAESLALSILRHDDPAEAGLTEGAGYRVPIIADDITLVG